MIHRVAVEQLSSDIDTCGFARLDIETVGAGDARAVQQAVNPHTFTATSRPLKPEFNKRWHLLSGGQSGVYRYTPRRQTKVIVGTHAPEVACAGEDQKLILFVATAHRVREFEARIAQVRGNPFGEFRVREAEPGFIKRDGFYTVGIHFIQLDGMGVIAPRWHHHHLETGAPFPPKAGLRIETDGLVGSVAQVPEKAGHRRWWLILTFSPCFGLVHYFPELKRPRRMGVEQPRQYQADQPSFP